MLAMFYVDIFCHVYVAHWSHQVVFIHVIVINCQPVILIRMIYENKNWRNFCVMLSVWTPLLVTTLIIILPNLTILSKNQATNQVKMPITWKLIISQTNNTFLSINANHWHHCGVDKKFTYKTIFTHHFPYCLNVLAGSWITCDPDIV